MLTWKSAALSRGPEGTSIVLSTDSQEKLNPLPDTLWSVDQKMFVDSAWTRMTFSGGLLPSTVESSSCPQCFRPMIESESYKHCLVGSTSKSLNVILIIFPASALSV